MVFLSTLLTISIVGLLLLFGSKYIEARTGRLFFLPQRIHEQDREIERAFWRMVQRAVSVSGRLLYRSWRVTYASFIRFWRWVLKRTKRTIRAPLERNGGGSVYLKQMIEHKNSVRNGEQSD